MTRTTTSTTIERIVGEAFTAGAAHFRAERGGEYELRAQRSRTGTRGRRDWTLWRTVPRSSHRCGDGRNHTRNEMRDMVGLLVDECDARKPLRTSSRTARVRVSKTALFTV